MHLGILLGNHAYLIVGDLWKAFEEMNSKSTESDAETDAAFLDNFALEQTPGLFCVFDGHCGDHAARYAAEKFTEYLQSASRQAPVPDASASLRNNVLELFHGDFARKDVVHEKSLQMECPHGLFETLQPIHREFL